MLNGGKIAKTGGGNFHRFFPSAVQNELQRIEWLFKQELMSKKFKHMDTDNHVAPPIQFVYCFCLHNLQRHMCSRAIKTKLIGVAASTYQCL